ncbi:hypothetical protein HMPREF9440_02449 [Sutterella parvirubra YIT 11816]|uniref:Uncharacterized protein n=1 Tax=Sutterella parvirubra YIT 11816 TaxID=762967 RepID=H3KI47_9BURK|nr:hypothetical protein HMPREF9440_02449 [Sutterella parvirubra YIT 11816]
MKPGLERLPVHLHTVPVKRVPASRRAPGFSHLPGPFQAILELKFFTHNGTSRSALHQTH